MINHMYKLATVAKFNCTALIFLKLLLDESCDVHRNETVE